MIYNSLKYLSTYKVFSNNIKTAIEFVEQTDLVNLAKGKYEIKDKTIFAIVNEYETLPIEKCLCESHKKYIDLQILILGKEKFGIETLTNQLPKNEYNASEDVLFYDMEIKNFIHVHENEFVFFFPFDIHQPEICVKNPEFVKKIVIKIENDL